MAERTDQLNANLVCKPPQYMSVLKDLAMREVRRQNVEAKHALRKHADKPALNNSTDSLVSDGLHQPPACSMRMWSKA